MIIFLYGEDTFRSHQKLQELKTKFLREVDSSGLNLGIINSETPPDKLQTILFSSPFAARKRMVFVVDVGALSKDISQGIESALNKGLPEDLIFVARLGAKEQSLSPELVRKLKKNNLSEEFNPLKGRRLEEYILKIAKDINCRLDRLALQALLLLTQGDLWQISNELMKLAAFSSGQAIRAEDVYQLVIGGLDENIFHLTDALTDMHSSRALTLLNEQLKAGLPPVFLLSRLIGHFRLLLAVRILLDQGKQMRLISGELSLHPFVGEKISRQIKNWSGTKLKEAYRELLLIDIKIKSGQGDFLTLLSFFILRRSPSLSAL